MPTENQPLKPKDPFDSKEFKRVFFLADPNWYSKIKIHARSKGHHKISNWLKALVARDCPPDI